MLYGVPSDTHKPENFSDSLTLIKAIFFRLKRINGLIRELSLKIRTKKVRKKESTR